MNIFHAYHVQVQVSLYSFQKNSVWTWKFYEYCRDYYKEYDKSCMLLKMSFENTKWFHGKILKTLGIFMKTLSNY